MGGSDDTHKLKVFISYSREDMDFADELVGGLEIAGLEPTIDRHSIMEGEDWKKRLGALIADADTVVFVLSPASAQSDICAWEVDEAKRLSKRILPVLARPLGGIPAPKQLAELNYVRFDEDRSFTAGIKGLVRALNSDLDWLREHTRLLARARDWDAAGRAENRLLSGSDIDAAKAWIDDRPREAPEPTDLHLAFIQASEAAESARASAERKQLEQIKAAQTAREDALKGMEAEQAKRARTQRRVYVSLAVLALLMAGAGWAVYGQWAKLSQNRAQFIAAQAQQELDKGDAMTAMLLALEALPDDTSRRPGRYFQPYEARAEVTLDAALRQHRTGFGRELALLKGHGLPVTAVAFSPDGRRLATASSDNTARLWDTATGAESAVLKGHGSGVTAVAFSPDGRRLATASWDNTARLWEVFQSTDAIITAARKDLHRCLTPAQRVRFFLGANAARWCHSRELWPYTDKAGAKNGPPPISFSEYLVGFYNAVATAFTAKAGLGE